MKLSKTLLVFTSICNFFLIVQGESWNYSSNPDDYDFGWFATGTHPPGSEPFCTYCVNGLTYDQGHLDRTADEIIGPFWNLTVGTYRCDGVETNELWAYHEATQTIVFGNLTQVLCIDAVDWESLGVLKLRFCNSSLVSQQWKKEGSRVVSALLGSNKQQLFMVGKLPDKKTNPTNQMYEFYVTLNSSLSSVPVPGFSFTSEFTFLSARNLIDRSTYRFTEEGLLKISNSSVGEIINGGFESSTIQAGSDIAWSDYTQARPSYFSLCGWVIDYGPIDYVKSGLLAPAEGLYSIHLNTHTDTDHWGQVSQTIRTEVGTRYSLSFSFNGFPPQLKIESRPTWQCSPAYDEARLLVRITSGETQLELNYNMNVSNSNSINIGALWREYKVSFWASTNVTTVSFTSLNLNDSCGPMIDKVALVSPLAP